MDEEDIGSNRVKVTNKTYTILQSHWNTTTLGHKHLQRKPGQELQSTQFFDCFKLSSWAVITRRTDKTFPVWKDKNTWGSCDCLVAQLIERLRVSPEALSVSCEKQSTADCWWWNETEVYGLTFAVTPRFAFIALPWENIACEVSSLFYQNSYNFVWLVGSDENKNNAV